MKGFLLGCVLIVAFWCMGRCIRTSPIGQSVRGAQAQTGEAINALRTVRR